MLINGVEVSKGLIIKQPWINLILDGLKVWEMRSRRTNNDVPTFEAPLP